MPHLEYFVVCRAVQLDIFTDEVSLVNVLDDVAPSQFPYELPQTASVSVWRVDPKEQNDDYQATLVLKVPGKPDAAFNMNLLKLPSKLAGGLHRLRAIAGVQGIPLDKPGDLV